MWPIEGLRLPRPALAPRRPSELLSVLPAARSRDRRCRMLPGALPASAPMSDERGGVGTRLEPSAVSIAAISHHRDMRRREPCNHRVLNFRRPQACNFSCVIPEIDIWRAANLMLKRYGDKAL
jgi:hypothetical protein